MKRRVFLQSATAAAAAVTAAVGRHATGQTAAKVPLIGVLRWGTPTEEVRASFTGALAAIGYIEGRTIQIEWRWATRKDVAVRVATELAGMNPDLMLASATPAAEVLRDMKLSVPVVLVGVADPVASGLVASLARPGGNMTGLSTNLPAIVPKQLQLLRETVPELQRVAFLGSTDDIATPIFVQQAHAAARVLGIKMRILLVGQASEFESAADTMVRERIQAVVVQPLFTLGQSRQLAEVLNRYKLPSISALRPFAFEGGFMAYGPNRRELWSRTASFVDRMLKGAKPAELPIEEPTMFELAINQNTARALGLKVPHSLLLRADEVFQ